MNLVISGATKGIGRAIVLHFAKAGWDIAFCARNEQEVQVFQNELTQAFPQQKFDGKVVDCADKAALQEWASSLIKDFGAIDVLINNAGVYLPGAVSTEADGVLESQLQTNLMSAYHLTRYLLPQMLSQGKGHIFNMCSIASLQAYPGGGSYSISKYALLGFSDNLRLELQEKNIKVTSVLPGATWSNSWSGSGVNPERIMEAEDIAKMIYQCTQLSDSAVVERIVLRPQLGDL